MESKRPLQKFNHKFAVTADLWLKSHSGFLINYQTLVEARGVEPLSKGIATQASPSAVYALAFAPLTPTDRLRWRYLDKVSQSALRELGLRYPVK